MIVPSSPDVLWIVAIVLLVLWLIAFVIGEGAGSHKFISGNRLADRPGGPAPLVIEIGRHGDDLLVTWKLPTSCQ